MESREQDRLGLLWIRDCEIYQGEILLMRCDSGLYPLILGNEVKTLHAGACDPAFWPQAAYPTKRVPLVPSLDEQETHLLTLYEKHAAIDLQSMSSKEIERIVNDIYAILQKDYPNEWLLRWNLLEKLSKRSVQRSFNKNLAVNYESLKTIMKKTTHCDGLAVFKIAKLKSIIQLVVWNKNFNVCAH
ncbi:MAG: hypothetical protein IPJ88_01885 [Myxococcales bacterium]|nr:MAG: hypothetical protein IPJ88_01885 [Myxococcales bacterium]